MWGHILSGTASRVIYSPPSDRTIGPHAGRKALTLYSVPPMEETPNIPLLARVAGFSLHAARISYHLTQAWRAQPRQHYYNSCPPITRPK